MKKLLLFLLLFSSPLLADARKYSYDNPKLNDEIDSIYHDLLYQKAVNVTASTGTFTYIKTSTLTITGSINGLTSPPQNILDNGNVEIWQRGISFGAPAINTYTSDRWKTDTNEAAGVVVTQDNSVVDNGNYSMKIVASGSGASKRFNIYQSIENFTAYNGKTVTASVRIKSSVASACRISIVDDDGEILSSYHSGGGGWETLFVTKTIKVTTVTFEIHVGMDQGGDKKDGTYYIDSVMLVLGGTGAPTFVPTNPQVDFARSQRFFQVRGNTTSSGQFFPMVFAQSATAFGGGSYTFPVAMRTAPTATVTNATSASVNDSTGNTAVTALIVDGLTADGARFSGTVAAGLTQFRPMSFSLQGSTVAFSADL